MINEFNMNSARIRVHFSKPTKYNTHTHTRALVKKHNSAGSSERTASRTTKTEPFIRRAKPEHVPVSLKLLNAEKEEQNRAISHRQNAIVCRNRLVLERRENERQCRGVVGVGVFSVSAVSLSSLLF